MGKGILNSPIEKFTRMMFSRVIERLAQVMAQENLSFSQVAALHIIDQNKDITIQEIANRLNLSLSATSRLIDDLVSISLIKREEDASNRRSKILNLTKQGYIFLDKISVERVKIIQSTSLEKNPFSIFNKN